MALLVKLIFAAISGTALKDFTDICFEFSASQKRLLNNIVKRNVSCAFGLAHNFRSIRSVEDYRKAVPIGDYDSHYPYIQASMDGGQEQLTASPPMFFAVTSGTTGPAKYIPVTKESRSSKSRIMKIFLSALYRDHPAIFDGRILTVVSPEVQSYTMSRIPCGSESGYTYKNMPQFLRLLYSSPYDVYQIEDYEARYYTLMRIAVEQDVRMMYVINPSTVLLMARILEEYSLSIIKDIRDGTLSGEVPVTAAIREVIDAGLAPRPKRARELESALNAGNGTLLPRHVWPRLAALCCWKGGNLSQYIRKIIPLFPKGLPIRDIGYIASEHRSSIPMTDTGSSGVLAGDANLYEFVPAEKERPFAESDVLEADMLQQNRQYYTIITNHAGLYRYDIDDIIEVTGHYENAPLIRFVQKGKGTSSFTGEKLYEGQVTAAVEGAFKHYKGHYEFIMAVGEMRGEIPVYVFLAEFDAPCDNSEGRRLLKALERELRTRNVEYAAKRDSLRISPPVLRVIKKGEFEDYRRRKVAEGRPDSQFKIIRLSQDPSFMNEFLYEREISLEEDNP